MLKSETMNLSAAERGWLPLFGATGKLKMGWSTHLNRHTYPTVERIFEGVAATRVRLLTHWAEGQWEHLAALAEALARDLPAIGDTRLREKLGQARDFSELFVVGLDGRVLRSTAPGREGAAVFSKEAFEAGLRAPFLHGPYVDPLTLRLGRSSSRFHDAVTLMFHQPVIHQGEVVGLLCGRVPNDVLGDLIQREAGHVYPESGDNYLFMVESRFDPAIQPGTALSRSRFEDNTFSHGENLKEGIHTRWGVVRVREHTEFEIRFTDPATGQLHPGVRETIRNGENLFVTYPGYSDYRHIPVIGKGVTFQLPGSADRWGMMCEGDLEEVYRRRSINVRLMGLYLGSVAGLWGVHWGMLQLGGLPEWVVNVTTAGLIVAAASIFYHAGTNRLATRLTEMTEVIRAIAEGGGNLTQRLDRDRLRQDESGEMGRWINSFLDNLDGTVGEIRQVAECVREVNDRMLASNGETQQAAGHVSGSIGQMLEGAEAQRGEIESATSTAHQMRGAMDGAVEQAREQFRTVQRETSKIRDTIDAATRTIQDLNARTAEIGSIVEVIEGVAEQTNLLALNAAIEAARAGDQGRGFAVVADEVRSLAARTAEATHDIAERIQRVQNDTRQAVSVMERGVVEVDEGLRQAEAAAADDSVLEESVGRMFATIDRIGESSAAQSAHTQGVAASTEQMTRSIAELQEATSQVRHTASKLYKLVGLFQVSRG
ncbi:methyl-accepting chemotaxis protein [Endothiovibrio diazotrophicus]